MRYLAIIALCLLPAALWAQQEAEDRGLLEAFIEDNLSTADARVDITGFRGALSSQAELDRLTIADSEGIWLTLDEVALSWSRRALLSGRLQVERLSARQIAVDRKPITKAHPAQAEAHPFALPDLPVSVEIGSVSAEYVFLGADILGQEASFAIEGALSLASGAGTVELAIDRLDAQGAFGLAAQFDNATRVLDIDLSLTEGPEGIVSQMLSLPGAPALDLTLAGTGPLSDFSADLAISTDGTERLSGRVVLGTNDDGASTFDADLSGDMAALVAPDLRPFFGPRIAFAANGRRLADDTLHLDRLSLTAAAIRLTGSLQLDPGGLPRRFDLQGDIGNDGAPVILPLSGPRTTLTAATIDAAYDADAGREWQAEIRAQDLSQPDFQLEQALFSGGGQIEHGQTRSIDAAIELRLDGFAHADPAIATAVGRVLQGSANIAWRDGAPVAVSALRLSGGGMDVSGEGTLSTHRAGLPYAVNTRLSVADLSRFAPLLQTPIRGAAAVDIQGTGAALSGAFDATLDGTTQNLQIGQPQIDPLITGAGQVHLRAVRGMFGLVVPELRVETDEALIEATGSLNGAVGGAVISASLNDLSKVDRNLQGSATLGTTVTWQDGVRATLHRLTAAASGSEIDGVGELDLSDPAMPVAAELQLSVEDLSAWQGLAGRRLGGSVQTRANGTLQIAGDQDVMLDLSGRASNLRLGDATADALMAGLSEFEALIHRRSGVIGIDALNLRNPQLSVETSSRSDNVIGFDLSLANMALLVPELPGRLSATGTAEQAGDNWRIDTSLTGPANTTARIAGDVAGDGSTVALNVTGSAPLNLANPFIAPQSVQGGTDFDLSLNGPPSVGALSGQVSIRDGRLTIPNLPVGLTEIAGQINLNNGAARLNIRANATSGGRLRLRGGLGLQPGYDADLNVVLNDIEISDGEILETSVDGEVEVRGPLLGNGVIAGQISLDTTEIRIPSGAFGQTGYVPEITHVNTPITVEQTRKRAGLVLDPEAEGGGANSALRLNLRIDAPNQIFVRGRGLDAELGGGLRLGGTVTDVIPSGRFELIRGRLDILGQRLTLSEGAIWMQGSLDPYLRLVASSREDDVELQIVIEGRASEPEIQFLSQPELPQDEVLARLLFGRGTGSLSPLQAARLASAAATLAGRGSGGVTDRLRQNLDLDDLDVGTDEEGGAQLRAGKYISDNAYTDVTVNSRGESEINLNLDVSRNVTVKGRLGAGGDSGIGIFFERDY